VLCCSSTPCCVAIRRINLRGGISLMMDGGLVYCNHTECAYYDICSSGLPPIIWGKCLESSRLWRGGHGRLLRGGGRFRFDV